MVSLSASITEMAVSGLTDNTMSETGKIINDMETGLITMIMEVGTLENGEMIKRMALELLT